MKSSAYLPANFEKRKSCKEQRLKVENAIEIAQNLTQKKFPFSKNCIKSEKCNSGFCPVCCRSLRHKLLRFAHEQNWQERNWLFVTIFVEGWTISPQDYTCFGNLRDNKTIKNLKQRIRRLNQPNTLVFGSIETVFKTISNTPAGKPFHLHLMVSGIDKTALEACIRKALNVDSSVAIPLLIKEVKKTTSDFARVASYTFKQPLWKKSYSGLNDVHGKKQYPKTREMAELIANMGAHASSERLILMGLRFHGGTFQIT